MNTRDSRLNIRRFLPLSTQEFKVLLVLKDQPHHGYGIVKASEEQFPDEPGIETGSLYRIVARLLDRGLLREVKRTDRRPIDSRARRYYQATELGLAVAQAEAERLSSLLKSPQALDLLNRG